jgi:preprotein translocase subunit SecG
MLTVLLVIHLMIASALVGMVLLQRSEGGALGIGGGGGGGFLTGRGTANLLTRATAALAACFFLTSVLLTIVGQRSLSAGSAFDKAPVSAPPADTAPKPAEPGPAPPQAPRGGILDKLK